MKIELEKHEAEYVVYLMRQAIGPGVDFAQRAMLAIQENGSLDGKFGPDIKATDVAVVTAYVEAIRVNDDLIEKIASQIR
jgi:hypothetical protein